MSRKISGVLCSLKNASLRYNVRYYSSCIEPNDVYVLSSARTPIGRFQGKLASLSAVDLASKALAAAIERSCVPKEDVGEVIVGITFQGGLGQRPAHQIALFSGLPDSILTSEVSRACGSGMKAIMTGAHLLITGTQEVVAVGGAESTSNIPYTLKRENMRIGEMILHDPIFSDGLICRVSLLDVTNYAEQTVREYNITRQDQDDYAISSFQKTLAAQQVKLFEPEIIPVTIKHKKGEEVVCEDENLKIFNEKKLRTLPPDIGPGGTITPGNASGLNDGAGMLILCTGNYALKKNLKPLAKILSIADASLAPKDFTLAPSVCIPKALKLAKLTPNDIYRWEISETFAVTAIVNTKLLKLDPKKVNVHGGAIALGHPFAMTGARLVGHLAYTLPPKMVGVASISYGGGGASAVVVEKIP